MLVHAAQALRFWDQCGTILHARVDNCSERETKHQLRFFITWSPLLEPLLSCLACHRLPTMLSRFDLVMFAMLFASSSLFAIVLPCSLDSAPTTGLRTPCKNSDLVDDNNFFSVAKYLAKEDYCELMVGGGLRYCGV